MSQHIDPLVLKFHEENEDIFDDSITITHHLEGSEKRIVEIISSDSNDELAMLFLAALVNNLSHNKPTNNEMKIPITQNRTFNVSIS